MIYEEEIKQSKSVSYAKGSPKEKKKEKKKSSGGIRLIS